MSNSKSLQDNQKKIRNKVKSELERLEKIQKDTVTMQLLDSFKNKYNICETVYKVALKEHQIGKKKKINSYLNVTMKQVPHALNYAGYTFDKALLSELFGSKSEKGKTVKKLRDAVTHGINEDAVEEITQRKNELFEYMDEFLNTIKIFDKTA